MQYYKRFSTFVFEIGANTCLLSLIGGFSTVAASGSASTPLDSLKKIEISAKLGPGWSNSKNTHIGISHYETDRVLIKHVSNNIPWGVSVGMRLWKDTVKQHGFFNEYLVNLSLYHSTNTMKGIVWQYGFPQFNNYTFRAPLSSTRLMLELKPGLFTWKALSPYPVLGLGFSVNDIAYHEKVIGIDVDPTSYHYLNGAKTTSLASGFGAGIRATMTERLYASLEYLYTNLGHMSPSDLPHTPATLISTPRFKLCNQSLLLGISYTI